MQTEANSAVLKESYSSVLISDKIDFKTKIIKHKEGYFIFYLFYFFNLT